MQARILRISASGLALAAMTSAAAAQGATMELLGRYEGGADAAAEISAYDSGSRRLFITNGANGKIDVVDAYGYRAGRPRLRAGE